MPDGALDGSVTLTLAWKDAPAATVRWGGKGALARARGGGVSPAATTRRTGARRARDENRAEAERELHRRDPTRREDTLEKRRAVEVDRHRPLAS